MKIGIGIGLGFEKIAASPEVPGDPIGDALRANCVAYWKMDEASGPWADSTEGNHPLFVSGDDLFSSDVGIVGNSVGYIDTSSLSGDLESDSIATLENWSWSGWVKFHTTAGPGNMFTLGALPNNSSYVMCDGDDSIALQIIDSFSSSYPVSAGNWHHVVVTSDSLNHSLYIDGVFKETVERQQNLVTFAGFFLATGGWNETDYLQLDETGFFDVQLTAEQIDYLYNSGSGRTLYP